MAINYFEPYVPAYVPANDLTVEYRGFQIRKQIEVNLYLIVVPEGKILHKSLDGSFTKLDLIKSQVDIFLKEHGTHHVAFTDLPDPKPKRGRPKLKRTAIEALADDLPSLFDEAN
jgi:hypothetical protein